MEATHEPPRTQDEAMRRETTVDGATVQWDAEDAAAYLLGLTVPEEINEPDQYGWTALHRAAHAGDVKAVHALIQMGADLHALTEGSEWTALHAAADAGSTETVELLIQLGVDMEARNEDGATALHLAADNSGVDTAEVLLRAGADVNAVDGGGWTTVFYAASGGSIELFKMLVELGQDPLAIAKDGRTTLHAACTNGKRDLAEYLVGLGVDVNSADENGRTPLHNSSLGVGDECMSFLLSAGAKASVNFPDKRGNRPLHFTAGARRTRQTKELLEAGADVHALTDSGDSPLLHAVFASESNSASSTVSVLCSFGAEWTSKCHDRLMALKASVEASDADASDERFQHLQWCMGLRACVLHWEKQHREGVAELTMVPREVIHRGEASVKTYLADATASNADELVYRCKVCVVGPSEWGKSSLVRSIETMKPFLVAARDRTIGIELVPISFEKSSETTETTALTGSSKRHEVTFWDFAGQDVYQLAHSLFFSRRTLYVLIIDVNAYSKQLDAVKSLRSAAAEAAMDRFLSRNVFRWIRSIFARHTDAEFFVLGTKADLLNDEEMESARVWRDLQSRVYQWKLNYIREMENEFEAMTKAQQFRVRELKEKLHRLASDKWLVVSVTRHDSIRALCQALRGSIEASECGFPMWNKYSRVLQAIAAKRDAANRPGDGLHRIQHGMMLFRPLCAQLMDEVEGLEYDECRDILRTLHDLGEVIWYERHESGQLRDFIILDPMLVIHIVREVISHDHMKTSGVYDKHRANSVSKPRIDGRVSHSLLETFPLWKHMDKELMYAFKVLLKQFQLAYPADDEVMDPESDLIVPSYWKVQLEAAGGGAEIPQHRFKTAELSLVQYYCWEYDVSADLADAVFEQFAVQSYTSFMKREVQANCIESRCAEFDSWITLHPGKTKHDVIRVEVASQAPDISWLNMRYYLMKLEKVLDGYSGLAVPRYVVVNGKRRSIATAAKALRDTILMGRTVDSLRAQMPWFPPDLDWFISRAWRDISVFKELQMMHLVRDKLNVLQKLVVKGDSLRRYPALWSLEYKAEARVVVLRMLSDLSGRCYHVPIEIEVPAAFLAKHGSKIKEGISLLANVVPSSLSAPILQTAINGAVSCLEAKTKQAVSVHNLIDQLDLAAASGRRTTTSGECGLSPGGAMAVLRDLLKLHNDSLDELSITEICNLECAATSKGEYVWAHAHEISMLKKELTPCQPRFDAESEAAKSTSCEPHEEPQSTVRSSSKLRLSLCIERVTGLADWDWYKTYCTWQLVYGDMNVPVASGATTSSNDSSAQPSWSSLKMTLDAIDSAEMLRGCRLVVQVKRRSRIGWTKLIGEGQVELRSLAFLDAKLAFKCRPIEVELQTNGPDSAKRIVLCNICMNGEPPQS